MKTNPLNALHSFSVNRRLAAACVFAGFVTQGLAATYYWTGTNGGSSPAAGWNLATNWSANDDGTGAAAIPGEADTAYLGITTATTGQTILLNANQSIAGLQIRPAQGAMTISSGTGTNTLTIGTGGITIGAGAGITTLNAGITLNGNQAWANSGGTLLLNNSLSGTGNLTISGNFNATNGSANLTGIVTLTGQSDLSGAFLNGVSGGVVISTGTVGAQGASVTSDKNITFTGTTNWYTNGSNALLSGAVLGGTMNNIGGGNLTLSGSTDNTGLTVNTPGGTTYLAKNSSATVHAIGTALSLAANSTARITGTGGDQIKDTANVTIGTGASFDLNGNSETINNLSGSGVVTNTLASSNSTLTLGKGNGSATFSGIIQNGAGTLGLTKTGTGTQTLTGSSAYTGATTVNGGTLKLDFSAVAAPASNIISGSSSLALGGGTLNLTGKASSTNSQSVNGLSLTAGASAISLTNNVTSNPLLLTLGEITRSVGGSVNFTQPTGTLGATHGIATTTSNTNGILGGYATVGGTDWATNNGTNIVALGTYTNNTWASGNNTTVTSSSAPSSASTTNSLRFNTSGAQTVTLAGTNTITSGGILVTNAVGGNTSNITGGSLRGSSGADLVVINNNTNASGSLSIGSAIVDNGGATGLTKSGVGSLVLNGANTYTGATHINGPVTVTNISNLGSNSAVNLSGTGALNFTNIGGQLNLSGLGATATASSGAGSASAAIDNNTGSRWESAHGVDPQWIYIDLKASYNIASVNIWWEGANAKTMQLQTATSNANTPNGAGWTTALNVPNQNPITNGYTTYNLPGGTSGQYLAMYGTARNLTYGYSIWEMQVFTAAGAITQNIGSLSSLDSTTSVSLGSQLTLSTGANNTSTTFAGAITGTGNLTKVGTGTQTLSGTNTYTGTTLVSEGKLMIDGSTSTGAVTVSSGATLGGTGTIGGATTIQSGGIHAPGNSPGIEKFTSSLTYADGSIFAWDIDRTQTGRGTGYDAVNVTGAVAGLDGADEGSTLNAIFRIVIGDSDFSDAFWSVDRSWTDIFTNADGTTAKTDWAGIFGGGFQYYHSNGSALAGAPTTGSFSLSGNTLSWTYSAVPEVSNLLAGVLLGAGLLRRKRRTT